jgi:hypothetical protein
MVVTNVDLNAVRGHVEVLKWCGDRLSEIRELQKNARDAIEEVLADNEIGELDGKTVITWASHKKRQLNQAAMKEAHPDIVEEFTDSVEQRTFRVVNTK